MAPKYAKDQPEGFTNKIEKVAIVGASGTIGKWVVQELLKTSKHSITAITRKDSSSKIPEGVKVAKVNYDDDSLVEALRGQQFFIITMSIAAPRDTVSKLIAAAAKAGVPYVLPNWTQHDYTAESLSADSFLKPASDMAISMIKELGVSSYFFLVCNFWYEHSLAAGPDDFGFDIKKREIIMFDDGKQKINVSTWPQCGKAIASVLSLPELPRDENDKSTTLADFANGAAYISSFRLSQYDMFESIKRVTKTTDADWKITHESAEQRWKDAQGQVMQGNLGAFTKMIYSRMFFNTGEGDYESKRGLDNAKLGLPEEDLDTCTKNAIEMAEKGYRYGF